MKTDESESLIQSLQDSQKKIATLLNSVVGDQDWKPAPDEWSFRDIAAHMATNARECLQARIERIASGQNPRFDSYLDSGRDFSQLELEESLSSWAATRQEIFDFVRALPEEKFAFIGAHVSFGEITILDYMRIDLEHDQEHLRELKLAVDTYRKQKRTPDAL